VLESTYGGRHHADGNPSAGLRDEVLGVVKRGGALVIPAFAVGRTQEVLFELRALEERGEIPELPVFVDSPMAVDATPIHVAHREEHDDEMIKMIAQGRVPLRPRRLTFARSPDQSKAINRVATPCIILSASGMATGGRVLHHLARCLPDPANTVLLVGFQAAGTRGWSLQNGAATLRIHGEEVPVKARIATLTGFSAHADEGEICRWLGGFERPPGLTLLVHGEPTALAAAASRLDRMRWTNRVPTHLEEVALT
jgi:metallo-beta-lactamase family protein